jgi:hypothetical protein
MTDQSALLNDCLAIEHHKYGRALANHNGCGSCDCHRLGRLALRKQEIARKTRRLPRGPFRGVAAGVVAGIAAGFAVGLANGVIIAELPRQSVHHDPAQWCRCAA